MRFNDDVDVANRPRPDVDHGVQREVMDEHTDTGQTDETIYDDSVRETDQYRRDASHTEVERLDAADRSSSGDNDIRHYISLVLRYKLLIACVMVVSVSVTVVRILLKPETYMAKATILPSGGQGHTGVLGLIASFTGAPPLSGMSEENSSFLFPSILESRQVGLEVLRSKYAFRKDGETVEATLEDLLQAESIDKALRGLYMIASFDVHKETGLITVAATTRYPELSAQIVNRFVDTLERVNLEMRRSTARQNSSFVLERLEEALRELHEAESALTKFRKQNVRINSAELELEQLRLERDVHLKSQLFITLSNQAEVARIDEAKDLPVVRILDRAAIPKAPVPVPKLSSLALGGIAGVLFAIMAVAAMEIYHYLRRQIALCRQTG